MNIGMPSVRTVRLSFADYLLFSFLAGVIAGTLAGNLWGQGAADGRYMELVLRDTLMGADEKRMLFLAVLRQRLTECALGWLVGMTSFGRQAFYAGAGYAGVTAGIVMTLITCQEGVMGLPCYVLTWMPQIGLYLPIWAVLAMWASESEHKPRALPCMVLAVLTCAGAWLETWACPVLCSLFRGIFL